VSTRRIVLLAVAALVAINLLGAAIDAATGGIPGGPRSSTYATGRDGLAAYYDLLPSFGHPVERLRSSNDLDPSATVIVLDPDDVSDGDAAALRRFVRSGGRLVAGGARPQEWLPDVAPGGRGRVRVADPSRLQNRALAEDANAAYGVDLAGPPGRRVAFLESVHGYGRERGLAALPERWKWTLAGLLLAAAAWVASRVRRLGPAEDESRPLPPPRRAYVDAVGAALARTHRPSASAERVRAAARQRVARRAGLGPEPADDAVTRAAATLGLSDDEAAMLTRPARDDDEDLLLAGRALARTDGRNG
jgi:hypothetical protein